MKKEIISQFKEKPKTKVAWWAMYLGLIAIFSGPLAGINAAVVNPWIARVSGEKLGLAAGFVFVFVILIVAISALVTGTLAYRKGERSWVMWVGLIPAILAAAFWIFMVVGEILFPH
jgi:hypothetical protein